MTWANWRVNLWRALKGLLATASVLLFAATASQWTLIAVVSERWWLGTVALFAPRWPLLVPIAAVVCGHALLRSRWLALDLSAALLVAGPVMGLCWSLPSSHTTAGSDSIRMMTANLGGADQSRVNHMVERIDADIVAFQEYRPEKLPPSFKANWHVLKCYGLCLVSRYPLKDPAILRGRDVGRWSDVALRATATTPLGDLTVVVVHFETPRWGLQELRLSRHGIAGIAELNENTAKRAAEAAEFRSWLGNTEGPLVLAGDFNAPSESNIFQAIASSAADAYQERGLGYGYTKFTRWHGVRIDHVVTQGVSVMNAVVEDADGGDHRPLVVNISMLNKPRTANESR